MSMPLVRRSFTVEEYHRPEHSGCVGALTRLLARQVGGRALVWVQNPVHLPDRSEPQPDVALLRPRPDGYRTAHPLPPDILLVIEVADASLESDRAAKLPLYAHAGISDVWLVNLLGDVIEISREPRAGRYRSLEYARRGAAVTPLAFPALALRVDDILG